MSIFDACDQRSAITEELIGCHVLLALHFLLLLNFCHVFPVHVLKLNPDTRVFLIPRSTWSFLDLVEVGSDLLVFDLVSHLQLLFLLDIVLFKVDFDGPVKDAECVDV